MKALINSGAVKPEKLADTVVIFNDGDIEAHYSAAADVLHIIDLDSGFALTSRKNLRDIDHAREIVAAMGF